MYCRYHHSGRQIEHQHVSPGESGESTEKQKREICVCPKQFDKSVCQRRQNGSRVNLHAASAGSKQSGQQSIGSFI